MTEPVKPGQVWINSHTQTRYRVLHLAGREHDLAPLVIYQRDGHPESTIWAQPLGEWLREEGGVPRYQMPPQGSESTP